MRQKMFLMLASTLIIVGCNKNKQKVESAESLDTGKNTVVMTQTPDDQDSKGGKKQVAEGEMEELLVTLERVHFAFDSAELSPSGRAALRDVADKLHRYPGISLYVDGHTDRRGTTEYNLSLGERRAQSVVAFLTRLGIDRSRLRRVSFGEEVPLERGSGQWVFAENRRVGFRVMDGDVELVLKDGTLLSDNGRPLNQMTSRN